MAKIPDKSKKKAAAAKLPAVVQDRPSFLSVPNEDTGLELLTGFITPPRLKVIHKMSGDSYAHYNPGDVIVAPAMVLIAPIQMTAQNKPGDFGDYFYFTPLFFYAEWCTWNPIETRGMLPPIRGRTFDIKSELAAKARNPERWFEPCPEKPDYRIRHCEHLNFITQLHHLDFDDIPVVLSFSRGSHRSGSNFAALAKMRNAPLYGCTYAARATFMQNAKGTWHTIMVESPPEESGVSPWIVDEEEYERYKELHLGFKENHASSLIRVEYDDVEVEVEGSTTKEF